MSIRYEKGYSGDLTPLICEFEMCSPELLNELEHIFSVIEIVFEMCSTGLLTSATALVSTRLGINYLNLKYQVRLYRNV